MVCAWIGTDGDVKVSRIRVGYRASGLLTEFFATRWTRRCFDESSHIGSLVCTPMRFGNPGTAQSCQSSGPGDPCGPGTQSEGSPILHGIPQMRSKGRGGEDQPGGNCGRASIAGAVHSFNAEARRTGRPTLFLEYS